LIEPHLVTVIIDIDKHAEGDKKKAENKADYESGGNDVVQEILFSDLPDHFIFTVDYCIPEVEDARKRLAGLKGKRNQSVALLLLT